MLIILNPLSGETEKVITLSKPILPRAETDNAVMERFFKSHGRMLLLNQKAKVVEATQEHFPLDEESNFNRLDIDDELDINDVASGKTHYIHTAVAPLLLSV